MSGNQIYHQNMTENINNDYNSHTLLSPKYQATRKKDTMLSYQMAESMNKLQQELRKVNEEKISNEEQSQNVINELEQKLETERIKNSSESMKQKMELKSKDNKIEVLQQSEYSLQNQLKLVQTEKNEFCQRFEELQKQHRQMKDINQKREKEYLDQIGVLKQQSIVKSESLSDNQYQVVKLTQQVKDRNEEIETLQMEISELEKKNKKEINEFRVKNQYLYQQINTIRDNNSKELNYFNEQLNKLVEDQKQKEQDLKTRLEIVENQLKDKTGLIESRDSYIKELNEKIVYQQSVIEDHQKKMLANESTVFSEDEPDEKEIDMNLSCKSIDRNETRVRNRNRSMNRNRTISMDSKKKEKELKTMIAAHKVDNYNLGDINDWKYHQKDLKQVKFKSDQFMAKHYVDPYNNEVFDLQKQINQMETVYDNLEGQFKRSCDLQQKSQIRQQMVDLALNIQRMKSKIVHMKDKYDRLLK